MLVFRSAKLGDIEDIQRIEREYYEGFSCSKHELINWIGNLSENFIVAEKDLKIIGFIFFEYLDEIKAIPFIHKLEHKKKGKYAYLSEIGVFDNHEEVLQQLFERMIEKAKKDGCEKVIWLTGQKHKHDKIETNILIKNKFIKLKQISKWEAFPDHYVSDHWLYKKVL
jgi:N-acetylglutamate synthase-like GNAT family acetyltransferase